LSISENTTDFEHWLAEEFAANGAFTALIVLVDISETKVTPQCSTYLNIIGTEVDWGEMTGLFAGAGVPWNGAAFFPATGPDGGPLDNPTARLRLRTLEERLSLDRLVLNDGRFFDQWGRKLKVEEVDLQ
jgi:hypothetical protein